MFLLLLPVANVLPSGLKLTLLTALSFPCEGADFLACLEIPEFDGLVSTASS